MMLPLGFPSFEHVYEECNFTKKIKKEEGGEDGNDMFVWSSDKEEEEKETKGGMFSLR